MNEQDDVSFPTSKEAARQNKQFLFLCFLFAIRLSSHFALNFQIKCDAFSRITFNSHGSGLDK